ncbi:hypothetical protein BH23VER1_BH23VER1_14510 [soil metagenome]
MSNSLLRFLAFAGLCSTALAQDIFWSETGGFAGPNLGAVYTAAFDGSGKSAIATGLNRPIGVDLDVANGHVYWAEDGFDPNTSQIVRANLDGSDPVVLFSEAEHGFTNAQMLALDLANGHVYWTDYFAGVIRGDLDGTGYTLLAAAPTADHYTALALDLANGHIYFADPTQFGILFRSDLDGGNGVELARGLADDNWRFNSIALDVPNGHIYYTDAGTDEIKRMDLQGANQVNVLNDPGLNPYGVTLRSDSTMFWVGGLGQRLGTAATDGFSNVNLQVVSLDSSTAFGIAVMPAPLPLTGFQITEITAGNSTVNIRWQGGTPPYQLVRSPSLTEGSWQGVGAPTMQTQATDTKGDPNMFYRVQSAPGSP